MAITLLPYAAVPAEVVLGGVLLVLGAMTAACSVVAEDGFEAALAATVWMNVAGELAAERAAGPGSFRMELLDALDRVGAGGGR